MTAAADIFLSYNREDQAVARQFADAFGAAGLSVWWDTTLRAGEAYDEVTEQALRGAKAVVVLWSPRSVVSRWVRAEATLADRNKTLVPVMIEPCERPIMFELTQTAELSHWQGAADDKAWRAFLADVRRHVERHAPGLVERPVPAPSSAPAPSPAKPGQYGERPSLAVLPFANRSGLAEDDVFAIGMVEDIIDALSQGVNVRVLASTATAGFLKGAITDLAEVGARLGVRYLLEGNVRRSGANLRVTAQLVEAASSAILWTQKFERPLSDLAALQEELVLEVAGHLDTQVQRLEMARVLKKPADLTAWEAVTRSMATFRQIAPDYLADGVAEAERAIAIAPEYGAAHAVMAIQRALNYLLFQPDDPAIVRLIRSHVDRALALDPDNAVVLACAGQALNMTGRPQEGLPRAERAIRLSPSYGFAHFVCAMSFNLLDRPADALAHLDADSRAAPGSHIEYINYFYRAIAHVRAKDPQAAIVACDRSIMLNADSNFGYGLKAAVLASLGQMAEAREELITGQRAGPTVTLEQWRMWFQRLFAGSSQRDVMIENLDAAWAATETAA